MVAPPRPPSAFGGGGQGEVGSGSDCGDLIRTDCALKRPMGENPATIG